MDEFLSCEIYLHVVLNLLVRDLDGFLVMGVFFSRNLLERGGFGVAHAAHSNPD